MVPLAFGAMRRQEPDHPRPFKLPAGEVLAPIAFIVANLVIYWTGWDSLAVAVFSLAIYFYAVSVRLTPEEVRRHVADARNEAEEEEELAV
jgi:amino acid transporter